jgi:Zn-dependent protease
MFINLVLAVFNMIPLPPLDGGRVAVGLLPYWLALPLARLERWGFLIIIAALFILPFIGNSVGLELDFLARWIFGTVTFLMHLIGGVTGVFEGA